MEPALINLLYLIVVVGIFLLVAKLIIGIIPMDATFKQIATLVAILIAVLIILKPILGLLSAAI